MIKFTRALDGKEFYVGAAALRSSLIEHGVDGEGAIIVFASKTIAVVESVEYILEEIQAAK